MRNLVFVVFILLVSEIGFGQNMSNYNKYIAGAETFLKFTDYNLENLNYSTSAELRRVESKADIVYYLRINVINNSLSYTASFNEVEIHNIINAIQQFKQEIFSDKEKVKTAQYIENKYITSDGYRIGYFVKKDGKSKWFIDVSNYSDYGTEFFNEVLPIETAFKQAVKKIITVKAINKD